MAEGGEFKSECDESNLRDQIDEVIALESIYGDGGPLQVICSPDNDAGNQCVLQISVPITLNEEGLRVQAWLPYEHYPDPPDEATAHVPAHIRPQFQRTESGERWHSSFQVFHLLPPRLHVTLPGGYPSRAAPQFSLSALWLDAAQLSALCAKLDELWQDMQGMPVVFTWVDWLQSDTLSFLGLDKHVVLVPYTTGEAVESVPGSRDPRALPECTDVREDLIKMLRYDRQEEWHDFVRSNHQCNICFDEKPGNEFFRISECLHHFCRECMTEYCSMHVNDGTVHQLTCADQDCKVSLPPAIIQDCLGDEAYHRWERLLLQKALDAMGDIEYCPRCNMPVVREAEEALSLANCMYCNFAFCTKCHEAWHSGSKCESLEEQMRQLEEESKSGNIAASKMDKLLKARRKRDEYLSKAFVKKISKPCPTCGWAIEKNEGCNKVHCVNCHKSMCWICGKVIKDYEHFSQTNCALFPGQNDVNFQFQGYNRPEPEGAARLREAMQDGGVDVINRIKNCPRCGQRCLKEARNNHLKCWACNNNFCFLCRQRIEGNIQVHFRPPSQCVQHSD